MDASPELSVLDVCEHFPFLASRLNFARWPMASTALNALALAQLDAGGQAVRLGRGQFMAAGLTPGQAGRARTVLHELERRGVVTHFPGAGRRPHLWSIEPSVVHWRAMPWFDSGRDAERVIRLCACRAARAVVARSPGQTGVLSRGSAVFRLSDDCHWRRPGLFPVETRDYGASRATSARRPGTTPPQSRDYGAVSGTPIPLLLVPSEPSSSSEEEEEGGSATDGAWRRVVAGIRRRTGQPLYGAPARELRAAMEAHDGARRVDELLAAVTASGIQGAVPLAQALGAVLECPLEEAAPRPARDGRREVLERRLAVLRRVDPAEVDPAEIAQLESELATLGI